MQEYLFFLQQSPTEFEEVVEKVVTPETWFFRDRNVFDYLMLLFKQGKFQLPIKILCLACSTGEEPYSIAMAFSEAGISEKSYTIDAVDVSKVALRKAKNGLYRKISFRGNELAYRERFFTQTTSGYLIHNDIKEQVRFYHANLLREQLPNFHPHAFNVIFCRNLLIYLDASAQNQIMTVIRNDLAPEGILFVGPAETQIPYLSGFEPVKVPGTYAFQNKMKRENHQIHFLPLAPMPEASRKNLESLELSTRSPRGNESRIINSTRYE